LLIVGGSPEEKLAAGHLQDGEGAPADGDQDQQEREDLRDLLLAWTIR
jgi:hypothetical protein